jgi:hypothetical protein
MRLSCSKLNALSSSKRTSLKKALRSNIKVAILIWNVNFIIDSNNINIVYNVAYEICINHV